MDTVATTAVSSSDRLGFTLFFALALHAVVIIGITFSDEDADIPQKTIEVTLAQFNDKEAPKDADFFAQSNQKGSGTSDEKALPATNQQADFQDQDINKQSAQLNPLPEPVQQVAPLSPPAEKKAPENIQQPLRKSAKQEVVTTVAKKPEQVAQKRSQPKPVQSTPTPTGVSTGLLARSLDLASLQAELDNHRELMSKKPKVKRLTSASTKSREDALYLDSWRKKIERIGNLNYPEEARRNKMYGSLRLLVAIKPDGSVKSIEILDSSGKKILDDAAIRIVQLAAPFQPFSVEMKKSTDLLEIIRTWKFEKRAYVY